MSPDVGERGVELAELDENQIRPTNPRVSYPELRQRGAFVESSEGTFASRAVTMPNRGNEARGEARECSSKGAKGARPGTRKGHAAKLTAEDEDDEGHISEMFSCNICFDTASNPVVTLCGHMFCWPCLYRWLQQQKSVRTCPVCKAGVDRDKVIPVYGRGGNEDPRKLLDEGVTPSRPVAMRPGPVVLGRGSGGSGGNHEGFMPVVSWFGGVGDFGTVGMTPEQQHQAFLSRLLLMLGSFVIMCLLLF